MATSLTPDRTDSPVPTGKQVSPGLSHSFRPSTAISASDQHPQSTQLASDVVPPTRPFETVFTVEGGRSNTGTTEVGFNTKRDVSGTRAGVDLSAPRLRRYDSPENPQTTTKMSMVDIEKEMSEVRKQLQRISERADNEAKLHATAVATSAPVNTEHRRKDRAVDFDSSQLAFDIRKVKREKALLSHTFNGEDSPRSNTMRSSSVDGTDATVKKLRSGLDGDNRSVATTKKTDRRPELNKK